jgi:hypothetical protein
MAATISSMPAPIRDTGTLAVPAFGCPCPHSVGPHPIERAGPTGHEELPLMPKDDVTVAGMCCWSMSPRRPGKSAAWVHEARDLNLPVEPGVRQGRDALVRWAVLLEERLP